jgi:protein-disulfide isomerase
MLVIGVVIIVVVVVAIIAITLSGGRTGDIDYASLPYSRATDGGFVLGNPDAPITIVEFADFGCPHCQEYHVTMEQFVQNYVVPGKAKFEYRIFPTAGGQLSYFTGQLLECAEEQKPGSFWTGYKLMFDYAFSGRYTQEVGRLLAQDLGLNYSTLLTCSSSATQVQTDINFGEQSGISGTPAVMVRYGNGPAQFIPGYDRGGPTYTVLASVADAAQ